MTDYSTFATPNDIHYRDSSQDSQEEVLEAEIVDTVDDDSLVETNPVAVLAETFEGQARPTPPLPVGETAFTESEAKRLTEEIKVKMLHAAEAQYDLVQTAQRAFDGHVWVALGYERGMKGWIAYCGDNFTADQIRVTGQQRTDLIMGFDPTKISNRGIAALLGVHSSTVDRAMAKRGTIEGKKRGADGKLRAEAAKSLTREERQAEIVRLHGEGLKQEDIAAQVGVTQSTVSEALRRSREEREGAAAAEPVPPAPVVAGELGEGEVLQPDDSAADMDMRAWIEDICVAFDRVGAGLDTIIDDMYSDEWQPGSTQVDEVMTRSQARLFEILEKLYQLLRRIGMDAYGLWPTDNVSDGAHDPFMVWADFVHRTLGLLTRIDNGEEENL
ncbi:helix-turn-helix domain-containing protein [Bifidobacterium thermacidophilum]|uniref:Helix-turn-helix domain-containing protein n=1 Tax=Bifidobacterium thermacidophilum TaxID=246618 RepID=A0ABW8KMD1_9BIFI